MDLTTTYMGLELKNPLVPSASTLTREVDNLRAMEDAGASAVVLESLFEEQIQQDLHQLDHYLTQGTESFAEALSYFPELEAHPGPEQYLKLIGAAKKAVGIPVIASLNGVSRGGWMEYAKEIEKAGADALELNIYFIPTDPNLMGSEVENMYVDALKAVKEAAGIPVAIKLAPYFSNMSNMARRLDQAGADGLVLFNRFYQPDIDIENLEVVPDLNLSSSADMRLPLRWAAILYGKVEADIAGTGGIHTPSDVIKMLMAGASLTQMAATLYKNGIPHLRTILNGIENWMTEHEYESVAQMRGSVSHKNSPQPAAFERANYMKTIGEYHP
ncbi:MAG: dihydroorotate dehydrogenase-like protein [Acidobacteriota bacterium]